MSFKYISYLPLVILIAALFILLIRKSEGSYITWVKEHFFYEKSKTIGIYQILYALAFSILCLSFLDLRGKETKIKANISDQKTIIIIDASASMLVEDVRPNRFKKSLLMARHFVKKAVGHQIAVVLFSDTQKRLVPFTDDIDLLESRISGLEDVDITKGGSNIGQALRESVQYFKTDLDETVVGNILVFTDSEESNDGMTIDVPEQVNVAFVGVGTVKGGRIPLRTKRGGFRGYKKFNGKEVTSQLDENYLKDLGSKIKNYKYWVALSYTIPTEEILSFFRSNFKSQVAKGDIRVRPVLANYLLIPFCFIFALSVFMKRFKSFIIPCLLLSIFGGRPSPAYAQEPEKVEKKMSDKALEAMGLMASGKLSSKGKVSLAGELLKTDHSEQAYTIFKENIRNLDNYSNEEVFNYGTAALKNEKLDEGVNLLKYLRDRAGNEMSEDLKKAIRNNIKAALKKKKEQDKKRQQDQKKKEEKKKQDKKNKENQKKGQSGEQKDKEDQENSEKGQQDKKDSKNSKDSKDKKEDKDKNGKKNKDNKNKKDKKDKEKSAKEKKEENKKEEENLSAEEQLKKREDEIRKKRKMVKIPAAVRQIMDEDKNLQKKYMNTTLKRKRNNKKYRDW